MQDILDLEKIAAMIVGLYQSHNILAPSRIHYRIEPVPTSDTSGKIFFEWNDLKLNAKPYRTQPTERELASVLEVKDPKNRTEFARILYEKGNILQPESKLETVTGTYSGIRIFTHVPLIIKGSKPQLPAQVQIRLLQTSLDSTIYRHDHSIMYSWADDQKTFGSRRRNYTGIVPNSLFGLENAQVTLLEKK